MMDPPSSTPSIGDMRITFIGLGQMGQGMASNLSKNLLWPPSPSPSQPSPRRNPLTIYNRTPSRSATLAATLSQGSVIIAPTLADAISSAEVVLTCVSDDDAVREIVSVAEGLEAGIKGKLFVECSTIHPLTTAEVDERVRRAGGRFVACPVFGAPDRAHTATLIGVPSGPAPSVHLVAQLFANILGDRCIPLPDQPPASASTLKVIGNSMIFNMLESIAEAHLVAEKSGLPAGDLQRYIDLFYPGVYGRYSRRIVGGDYWGGEEPAFLASLALKDANHMLRLAKHVGAPTPALEVVARNFEKVDAKLGNKGDYVGVYGVLREEAGLAYENGSGKKEEKDG